VFSRERSRRCRSHQAVILPAGNASFVNVARVREELAVRSMRARPRLSNSARIRVVAGALAAIWCTRAAPRVKPNP